MSRKSFETAIATLSGKSIKKQKTKRDCQLCSYEKSVGKYYLEPSESENHGWWRVCTDCAEIVERVGANVQYYKYSAQYKNSNVSVINDIPDCNHDWEKHSLVGEFDKWREGIFDWMKCTKCDCYGKRFGIGHQEVIDLTMEIDLNCSR